MTPAPAARLARARSVLLLSLSLACPLAASVLDLELGDPERRGKRIPLVVDGITDARTGEVLSPAELAPRLAGERIVFLGESHTDMEFHNVQLRVIQELHRAGRSVVIGLEMYPYTHQEFLDSWVDGHSTEEGFLELSDWYESWGYHWNYYRDIFLYARDNGLPMFALNTPREVVSAVRKKGFDELSDEEKEHIPAEIDSENADHLALFKAFFEGDDSFHSMMSDEQWQAMFDAQCTWDAAFAHNAMKALESTGDPESVLVMLVGSGHVVYDLGIQRQLAQWSDLPTATVVPIASHDSEGELIEEVSATYADFVWGVPPETYPLYPMLGVSTTEREDDERRKVIHVEEATPAEAAGFEMGDVLLSMDGSDLPDRATFNRLMSEKRWGDTAVIRVERGGETVDLDVRFRRQGVEK